MPKVTITVHREENNRFRGEVDRFTVFSHSDCPRSVVTYLKDVARRLLGDEIEFDVRGP